MRGEREREREREREKERKANKGKEVGRAWGRRKKVFMHSLPDTVPWLLMQHYCRLVICIKRQSL
jgi:hypothetical protein